MKYLLLISLLLSSLFAEDDGVLVPKVTVKDTSGLSVDQVRKKAQKMEKEKSKKVSVNKVLKSISSDGKVNIQKIQLPWEELSPKTNGYDWIKTKKGEWFKGRIIGLYDDELEFDSEEMGIHHFDFDKIDMIKSDGAFGVNIEDVATFDGIVRLKGEKITIIQGDTDYEFNRSQVISFSAVAKKEKDHWSGKITLSFDKRQGNKDQLDYSAKVNLKRRTDSTRLSLDYLGRVAKKDGEETSNDHRINQKYDRYITRKFYWTPVFSEYYTDKYQNIKQQITLGAGIGYTIYDSSKLEWDISAGPAIIQTRYETVEDGDDEKINSPAFEAVSKFDIELTSKTDLIYNYSLTLTDENSGKYKHHMVFTLENELTDWLDLDISYIWDHINSPEPDSDGTVPRQDDYQLLMGLGIEF
jgi:putative salt-induced outer membrane protein YdiY